MSELRRQMTSEKFEPIDLGLLGFLCSGLIWWIVVMF